MRIRKAALADAGLITDFNLKLAKETESLTLDPERVAAGVTAVLKDASKGVYFLAEEDGEVAAQMLITYEWSDWRSGNFWWIQSVYVKEAFRQRGIFRAMFTHLQELTRENPKVCGLRLYVDADNERARRSYERLGMSQSHYQIFEVE